MRVNKETPLTELSKSINDWAHGKGWWEGKDNELFAKLLMIHTEITEATEEARAGNQGHALATFYTTNGKPEGFASELVDILIRTLDMCGELGIDVDYGMEMKMAFNHTRPFRHDGKLV